jgi:hypothetical protein
MKPHSKTRSKRGPINQENKNPKARKPFSQDGVEPHSFMRSISRRLLGDDISHRDQEEHRPRPLLSSPGDRSSLLADKSEKGIARPVRCVRGCPPPSRDLGHVLFVFLTVFGPEACVALPSPLLSQHSGGYSMTFVSCRWVLSELHLVFRGILT